MIGNEFKKQRLYHLAKEKKLSHAILITGPKGVGKFEFCIELAHLMISPFRPIPPQLMVVDDLYLDGQTKEGGIISSTFDQFHRKKEKKKTDTIGVEDINSFTRHLYETVEGDYKIVIIRNIERMTREASNHFLKVLEEPPLKTIFLMTSSEEYRILPTIFSRVQKEIFSFVSSEELSNSIPESFPKEKRDLLLQLSAGRVVEFFRLVHDSLYFDEAQKKNEDNLSFSLLSPKSLFEKADILSKESKEYIVEFLEQYLIFLRMEFLSKSKSFSSVVSCFDIAFSTRLDILANGNKKLVLENFFLKIREL